MPKYSQNAGGIPQQVGKITCPFLQVSALHRQVPIEFLSAMPRFCGAY